MNTNADILFFSTKKGSVTGIRFPNNKIWLIGSLPVTLFDNTYQKIIYPWMRQTMFYNFDAILLPFQSKNIVHYLEPILSTNKPNRVITFLQKNNDVISEENFHSFLNNYKVNHLKAKKDWKFIPSPNCTCTILKQETERAWYESENPAIIQLSFGKTKIIFNNDTDNELSDFVDTSSIRINNSTLQHFKLNLNKTTFLYSNKQRQKNHYITAKDGAVKIRLKL